MAKTGGKDLLVLFFALSALICAALSLNTALNQLAGKDE